MKLSSITILSLVLSFTSSTLFAGGNANSGKAKSATCVACHGKDGNSASAGFPKIAGQGEGYIYKQLKDFKSGARKDATMAGMVAALKDQDMQDLAAYYSSQTTAPNVAKKDETMLALGKAIYQGGKKDTKTTACIACHGVNGAGIPSAGFPQISFQHAAYTAKQLRDFRQVSFNTQTNGKTASRSNDLAAMMQGVAKDLTDTEIEALAQYISGLH
jgi:cytochrome c553